MCEPCGIGGGFQVTEGPLWIRREGYLLFSDVTNLIRKWTPGCAFSVFRDHEFSGLPPILISAIFILEPYRYAGSIARMIRVLRFADRDVFVFDDPNGSPAHGFKESS
jgi:sugar lactone lactonase YvrE